MNKIPKIISEYAQLAAQIRKFRLPKSTRTRRPRDARGGGNVMVFSPHPDDECIIGGLPLRLAREAGFKVTDVAVTLGSRKTRRAARMQELKRACAWLGFDLLLAGPNGLEGINPVTRMKQPAKWRKNVQAIADILKQRQPAMIFLPHARDGHPTHMGVHHLVMDALKQLPSSFRCIVVETEYWGQMTNPNLLVEVSGEDLADLVTALSFHKGEVRRNDYHARLPAWMMDNVRRGELICGAGQPVPKFPFATLYRLRCWKQGRLVEAWPGGRILAATKNPATLLR